jgi:hypothetical protein
VLESLLRTLASAESQHFDNVLLEAVETLIHAVKDDLVDFISDKHATFVVRCLLAFLSGSLSRDKGNNSVHNAAATTQTGCLEKLQRVQHRSGTFIISSVLYSSAKAHLQQLACSPETAAVLSRHVVSLANVFLGPIIDDDQLASLQRSTAASAFLQALIVALQDTCALSQSLYALLAVNVEVLLCMS